MPAELPAEAPDTALGRKVPAEASDSAFGGKVPAEAHDVEQPTTRLHISHPSDQTKVPGQCGHVICLLSAHAQMQEH